MNQQHIRNFSIIAHIDHGKSTLADRMLEKTHTVAQRDMKDQLLDQMELERERGITIKLAPVRMEWKGHILNLIDTPGHVDFTYEVSRALAAVEGAILLVDATQGIEAQTLANLYLALEQELTIIPVVNKIDLPNADAELVAQEVIGILGCTRADILFTSGKTGEGVDALLDALIERVPAPRGDAAAPLRALIFDSRFDDYQGVVAEVRVVDGVLSTQQSLRFLGTKAESEAIEVGVLTPKPKKREKLTAGEIGYVVTGLKDVAEVRVGDTISNEKSIALPLPGYREVKPMVFAGIYCKEGDDFPQLRDALEKLVLSDASLTYIPEHSPALGYGFRAGFLGLLHLEIIQERLKREYGLDLMVTVPSVEYRVTKTNGEKKTVHTPIDLPDPSEIQEVFEPIMSIDIVTPKEYVGPLMQFLAKRRGKYTTTEYLEGERAILKYTVPLSALLLDFYDTLKSASQGYASLNYELKDYQPTDVVRLDILAANEPVEPLASIVYRDEAYSVARGVVDRLKSLLPRQMFEVKIQGALGGKIIASASIPAMRKDVTAKLYGGDVTRKRKLLEKQKKGKKRMRSMGKLDIPQDAFLAILKRS
ncbi:MAG: translation elongation factor 4 [Patescibacteria group bacterium]|jgi:GTP-binding protein LepA